ncbi:MAG: S8 family peptidase, partial [Catalinimonas sp.]
LMKHLLIAGGLLCATLAVPAVAHTAPDPTDSTAQRYVDWHHADPQHDAQPGVSTTRAYEFARRRQPRTVVVAIIDSGVDVDHEDLRDNIWQNAGEVPSNGLDDDGNGYVDDVHGWNFLGNADGENIEWETLELTRLFRRYRPEFEGKTADQVPAGRREAFAEYERVRAEYDRKLAESREELSMIEQLMQVQEVTHQIVTKALQSETYTAADLRALPADDEVVGQAAAFLLSLIENDIKMDELREAYEHYGTLVNYQLNLEYDPRAEIIGDDPTRLGDAYGNNDVVGGDPEHGTHVAGIVAAARANGMGLDGIATDVRVMVLRAVPNGDERDKDIANAIRYAVDNGAHIINMSFGKSYSPEKSLVDEAVQLAEARGVLLVHAAGNEAENVDRVRVYPNDDLSGRDAPAGNWLSVGATSIEVGPEFVADFSNWGRRGVDLFAPGVDIYSTLPGGGYGLNSGTSMAAPVVSGVAALVWAYYPELTATQLRDVLLRSAVPYRPRVRRPTDEGKPKRVRFKRLSATVGVVNAYAAMQLAERPVGK